ncbi:DNA polymerase III subunit epsilon [Bauldia sp.]|uniref:DNA polymerase III subunit epsilon n=1 Tax=Bauldia sp. TaxID=2575872 RepID=UPI003BA8FD6E
MREIVFDTETTGLAADNGDRVVEIGCVELLNHIPTGETFHRYINPERSMPYEAQQVHGLDDKFLADKPVFAAIADELANFLGDAPLIAHNAEFDLAFLNAEFERCGRPKIAVGRIVDSLMLARRKHPAGPNSLDALCARYFVDTSRRTFHGALLDAELLSEVYIELIGGRQASLGLTAAIEGVAFGTPDQPLRTVGARPVPRQFRVTEAELAAHAARLAMLGDNAIWRTYLGTASPTPTAG